MTTHLPGSFFPSREDLAWAGGLFEGEGSISISRGASGKTGIRVAIGMTDEDVIRRFHAIVRLGIIGGPYGPYANNPHYKPMWHWRAHRFETGQAVLAALWPWLGERRRSTALGALAAVRDAPTRRYATKTKCHQGHERNEVNAYQQPNGHWVCRVCRRATERGRRDRRAA